MKKILIMLGAYYPNTSANGICVGRIVDELLLKGNEVFCLCNSQPNVSDTEHIGNLHIYRIKSLSTNKYWQLKNSSSNSFAKIYYSLAYKISVFGVMIRSLINFPVSSAARARKYYRTAEKIISKNCIDTVIGVNMPIEALYGAYLVKRKHQNIDFVPYCLDPVYGGADNKFLSDKTVNKRNYKFEQRMLEECTLFIAQNEHLEHFEKAHSQHIGKLRFVGVPLLVRRDNFEKEAEEGKKVLLYAGALSPKTRNPAYIFNVFKHVKNVRLKMYVSNIEDWVREAARGIDSIEINGRISHEEILKEMSLADAFLNIGNTQSMFCPSKIVEYISYGKPIVSLYRTDNDTCRDYMLKYPLGLYIDERAVDFVTAAEKIESFINTNSDIVHYNTLKEIYYDNTPEYIANIVCNLSNNNGE